MFHIHFNLNADRLDYWGNSVPCVGVTDRGANEWSVRATGPTNPYGVPTGQQTDGHGHMCDPMLVALGLATDGLNGVVGFKLLPGSPCIDSGRTIISALVWNRGATQK